MGQNDATVVTSREKRAAEIERFLGAALAGGERTVVALQEKARAAGLLGGHQSITDSRDSDPPRRPWAFTRAGLASVEVRFGSGCY